MIFNLWYLRWTLVCGVGFLSISLNQWRTSKRHHFSNALSFVIPSHSRRHQSHGFTSCLGLTMSMSSSPYFSKTSSCRHFSRPRRRRKLSQEYYDDGDEEVEYLEDYREENEEEDTGEYFEKSGNQFDRYNGRSRENGDTESRGDFNYASSMNGDDSINEVEEMGEESDEVDENVDQSRRGYYRVYFNDEVDPSETELDWEICSDGEIEAQVLLPPAAVDRPRAILHFVGGTFFGSAPKLWYRKLLEGIVRNTQTALIVTPIPVTLFRSPLQHIQLSKKLQRAFEYAWYTVLEDEYGEDGLQGVPLCGVGHSLGARLLTVLTTVTQNKPLKVHQKAIPSRRRTKNEVSSRIPSYKAFILISFTNYGASAGIPGVGTLLKQSRKQERAAKVNRERLRYRNSRKARNDWWLDDEEEEDEDVVGIDDEWGEVVADLQSLVKEQADRVKTALTPKSKDLEFFPSPEQLWQAVGKDSRYAVNETLMIQFDNDPVDQSSKLAQMLYDTNSSNVKFARLRGTHLTPVTVMESDVVGGGKMKGLLASSAGSLWRAILGKSKTKEQEMAMQSLRQSIVSYISDIVVE